jgi:hypothetical protein
MGMFGGANGEEGSFGMGGADEVGLLRFWES